MMKYFPEGYLERWSGKSLEGEFGEVSWDNSIFPFIYNFISIYNHKEALSRPKKSLNLKIQNPSDLVMWLNGLVYWASRDGTFVVFSLEGLNLFDIGDIVLDLSEWGQGLCRNGVSQILLDLHGDFNGIQRVQPMFSESACLGHTYINTQIPCL